IASNRGGGMNDQVTSVIHNPQRSTVSATVTCTIVCVGWLGIVLAIVHAVMHPAGFRIENAILIRDYDVFGPGVSMIWIVRGDRSTSIAARPVNHSGSRRKSNPQYAEVHSHGDNRGWPNHLKLPKIYGLKRHNQRRVTGARRQHLQ